ncbi:hypothetical protein A7K94_0202565 [Modestobacter sp. VKM Ac-2676]|nr:hypothetical protein A7K94_0202565 [Modestobacter sp. VKM Ac-2676]
MSVSITIHDVSDETRDELRARAARAGQSLQEYMRAHLTALAQRPSHENFWSRVQQRIETSRTQLPAEVILGRRDVDRW